MTDPEADEPVEPVVDESIDGDRWFAVVACGLVAGLVLGALVAWALGSSSEGAEELSPLVDRAEGSSPEDAEAFVEAWGRSRRETYLAVSEWHRVTDVGEELRRTRSVAQRPPDRVMSSGDAISGTVGGVRHQCDELEEGQVECREAASEAGTVEEFEASVDREVEIMWSYVGGDRPLYRVTRVDDECFDLRLRRAMHAPPYGARAQFCFDAESGAPSEIRIERNEGTDTLLLVSVTTAVTDDDLEALLDR